MRPALVHLMLAVIVCVASLGGLAAWYAAIGAKSSAVASLERQITLKTSAANDLASARASFAEIAGDEEGIRAYFVSDDQVVPFINDLEARGKKVGATVSVLSVTPGAADARPSVAFALSVTGTFDAVMRAVGAIEYAPYYLSIQTLSVVHDTKLWRADVKMVVGSPSTKTVKTP